MNVSRFPSPYITRTLVLCQFSLSEMFWNLVFPKVAALLDSISVRFQCLVSGNFCICVGGSKEMCSIYNIDFVNWCSNSWPDFHEPIAYGNADSN